MHNVRWGQSVESFGGPIPVHPWTQVIGGNFTRADNRSYRHEDYIVGDARVRIDRDSRDLESRHHPIKTLYYRDGTTDTKTAETNVNSHRTYEQVQIQVSNGNGGWTNAITQQERAGSFRVEGVAYSEYDDNVPLTFDISGDYGNPEDRGQLDSLPSYNNPNSPYHELSYTGDSGQIASEFSSSPNASDPFGLDSGPISGYLAWESGTRTSSPTEVDLVRTAVSSRRPTQMTVADTTAGFGTPGSTAGGTHVVAWMNDYVPPPPPSGSGYQITGPDVDNTDFTWRPWWWQTAEQTGGDAPVSTPLPVVTEAGRAGRWLVGNGWVNQHASDPGSGAGPSAVLANSGPPAGPTNSEPAPTESNRGTLNEDAALGTHSHQCSAQPNDSSYGEGIKYDSQVPDLEIGELGTAKKRLRGRGRMTTQETVTRVVDGRSITVLHSKVKQADGSHDDAAAWDRWFMAQTTQILADEQDLTGYVHFITRDDAIQVGYATAVEKTVTGLVDEQANRFRRANPLNLPETIREDYERMRLATEQGAAFYESPVGYTTSVVGKWKQAAVDQVSNPAGVGELATYAAMFIVTKKATPANATSVLSRGVGAGGPWSSFGRAAQAKVHKVGDRINGTARRSNQAAQRSSCIAEIACFTGATSVLVGWTDSAASPERSLRVAQSNTEASEEGSVTIGTDMAAAGCLVLAVGLWAGSRQVRDRKQLPWRRRGFGQSII